MGLEDWLVIADKAYFALAIVAAIATAGTVVAGITQNRLNARIGAEKDHQLSISQSEASDRIAGANRLVAEANERGAAAQARAAEAEARAAEANKAAEGERLARVKLQASLASRRLGREEASRLTASFSKIQTRVPTIKITILGDQEAHTFGMELAQAIQAAGIEIQFYETGVMFPPRYGIQVEDTADGRLKTAFASSGLTDIQYFLTSSNTPSIIVGLKPPPF